MRSVWNWVKGIVGAGEQPSEANPSGRRVQTSRKGEELPALSQKLDGSDLGTRGASAGEPDPMAQQPAKVEAHASLESVIKQAAKMEKTVRAVADRYEAHVADIAGDARSAEMDRLVSEGHSILEQFNGDLDRLREKLEAKTGPNGSAALQQETDQLAERIGDGRKNLFTIVTQTCGRRIEEMQTAASAFDLEHGSCTGDLIGDASGEEVKALAQRHGDISGERGSALEELNALRGRLKGKVPPSKLSKIQREITLLNGRIKDAERELLAVAAEITETSQRLCIRLANGAQAEAEAFYSEHGSCAGDLIGDASGEEVKALAQRHGDISGKRRSALEELNALRGKLESEVPPSELSKIQREITQVSGRVKDAERELLALAAEIVETSQRLCIQQAAKMEKTVRGVIDRYEAHVADIAGDTRSAEMDRLVSEGYSILEQFNGDLDRLREKLEAETGPNGFAALQQEIDQVARRIGDGRRNLFKIVTQTCIQWANGMQAEVEAFDSEHGSRAGDLIGDASGEEVKALAQRHGDISGERRSALEELNALRGKLEGKVLPNELSKIQREITLVNGRIKNVERKLLAVAAEIVETSQRLCIQLANGAQAEAEAFDLEHGSRVGDLIGDALGGEVQALVQRHGDISGERRSALEELNALRGKLESEVPPNELSKIQREITLVNGRIKDAERELLAVAAEIVAPARLFRRIASSVVESSNLGGVGGLGAKTMSVFQIREILKDPAMVIAMTCFDGTGKVDGAQVAAWHKFFANKENFKGEPYDHIPLFEHVRFQTFRVMERLLKSHEFVNTLEKSNATPLGSHGQTMQNAMSLGQKRPMQPGEMILVSLLSPHRQRNLPACTLHSWINWMLFNYSEKLAEMYASLLADGRFHTPSGRSIQLPSIADGYIPVDLERGGIGRNEVFKYIDSGDPKKVAAQIKEWQNEGVTYNSTAARHGLNIPALDLNDLCFSGIFQVAFGDDRINNDRILGTMHVLAGFPVGTEMNDMSSYSFPVATLNDVPNLILGLQREAQAQRDGGVSYMRASYCRRPNGGHDFNVNISELLAIDLDKMKDGEIRSIGDFNWLDELGIDIVHLAVQRTAEGFRLGRAYFVENRSLKAKLFPVEITQLWTYKTEIKRLQQPGTPKPPVATVGLGNRK